MRRNGTTERGGEARRSMPGRMRPAYSEVRSKQPCPCGSGRANDECHCVQEVDYLVAATSDRRRPQVSVHGAPLASDPSAYSSGIATRCHACAAVLTVGLGFGGEDLVLVCDCGARNDGALGGAGAAPPASDR